MSSLETQSLLAREVPAYSLTTRHAVVMSEQRFGVAKLNVKSAELARSPELLTVLGAAPPVEPNAVVRGDAIDIAWAAPNQWLLLGEDHQVENIRAAAETLLAEKTALLASLTHASAAFEVSKAGARDVLASLCPLDLHPRCFGAQYCASSLLGDIAVFIQQRDDAPTFRVIVDQSYAAYAWRLLSEAAEIHDGAAN